MSTESVWGPCHFSFEGSGTAYMRTTYFRGYDKVSVGSSRVEWTGCTLDCGHQNFDYLHTKSGGTFKFGGIGAIINNTDPNGIQIEAGSMLATTSARDEDPAVAKTDPYWDNSMQYLWNSYPPRVGDGSGVTVQRTLWHGYVPAGGTSYLEVNKGADFEGVSPRDAVRENTGSTEVPINITYTRKHSETRIVPVTSGGIERSNPWRIPFSGRLAGIFVVPVGGTVSVGGGPFAEYTALARKGVDFSAGGALLCPSHSLDTVADGVEESINLTTTAGALEMTQGEYVVVQFDNSTGTVSGPTSLIVTVVFDLD